MPVTDKLMKLLQAPMVLLPLGQASDRQNLPNERVRLRNLTKGACEPKVGPVACLARQPSACRVRMRPGLVLVGASTGVCDRTSRARSLWAGGGDSLTVHTVCTLLSWACRVRRAARDIQGGGIAHRAVRGGRCRRKMILKLSLIHG